MKCDGLFSASFTIWFDIVSQEQKNSQKSDKANCKVMLCRVVEVGGLDLKWAVVTFSVITLLSRERSHRINPPIAPVTLCTPLSPESCGPLCSKLRYVLQTVLNYIYLIRFVGLRLFSFYTRSLEFCFFF